MFYWELKKVILNLLQIKVLVQKRITTKYVMFLQDFWKNCKTCLGIEGDTAKLTCEKRV